MSEYQYYEFLAVDRPLTAQQIEAVRRFSSRAEISSTRFVNEYQWGDFRGDPDSFLARYYDLMLYFANWGTHRLLLGLPRGDVDLPALQRYQNNSTLEIRAKENRVLLDFISDNEEGDDCLEAGGWAASLAPIRTEIMAGDLRALFLAWLADATNADDDSDIDCQPIPAGLNELSAAQEALVEFLRVDADFLTAAARFSRATPAQSTNLRQWIASLPQAEKDRVLVTLASGDDPHIAARLQRQFRKQTTRPGEFSELSFASLRQSAKEIRSAREAAEQKRAARAREKRLAQEAAAREKRLQELASRQDQTWQQLEEILRRKQNKEYDNAVKLLTDLREIALRQQALQSFRARLQNLRETHKAKYTFVQRLDNARLLET